MSALPLPRFHHLLGRGLAACVLVVSTTGMLPLDAPTPGPDPVGPGGGSSAGADRHPAGTVGLTFTDGSRAERLIEGEVAGVSTSVRNTGTTTSGEVTLTVPVPAGMAHDSEYADGWHCVFGDGVAAGRPGWNCTHGPLRPGETSGMVNLSVLVSGAAPGEVLALTATATTGTARTGVATDTVDTEVTVLRSATVRGTVWLDRDRDGVRDPGEPGAHPGVEHVVVDPHSTDQGGVRATVAPDGSYVARVRPGTYRAGFVLREPYHFVESAGAGLAYVDNDTGGYGRYGYGDWVTLPAGADLAVDAGVTTDPATAVVDPAVAR